MQHELHLLMERVFNVPHMCTDAKLDAIITVLMDHIGVQHVSLLSLRDATGDEQKPVNVGPMVIADNVATLPVRGTLVSRVSGLHPSSGMAGYNQIADMYDQAQADPKVKRIVMPIETHGGEAAGAFALHDYIMEHKGRKPTTAVVDSCALSAGYLLATACDQIMCGECSRLANIGVVMAHRDMSQAMEKAGIKVTYIYAGKHKIDGAPTEPLSDEARAHAQTTVDRLYDGFVSRVASARHVDSEEIRKTEALILPGSDAIRMSLADGLGTERTVIRDAKQAAARVTLNVPKVLVPTMRG